MDAIWNAVSGPLMYGFAFFSVLMIVVFFHELGHFLVARWCGVKVSAFSIGFGPEIGGFYDRHGTRWKLSWIPLGGYVKFMDDENAASMASPEALSKMSAEERAGAFHAKPLWQRAAVVAAGPIANFILAIVIFTFWFWSQGVYTTEARVDDVLPDSPAARAGIKPGDVVTAIEGQPITVFEQIQRNVSTNVGKTLTFEINRGGQKLEIPVTPQVQEQVDEAGDKVRLVLIGVRRIPGQEGMTRYQPGFFEAIGIAGDRTWFVVTSTLGYFGDVVGGRQGADQLGGPIRIADVAGRVASQGWEYIIQLAAFLSVSVGLINLFPIPLLDGGHLMFYAIEAVRGRPLEERHQEIGFRIGMAVVLSLMIFATFNDLHILKRWLGGAV
ncbi:MAG: RIP metalloprotease RseP [Hyphomicrobium sp.]|nr:RIP metalloprotease RseP [Hyphomicrobium sp.]PPD08348.1 MAG: RIP metalloprotease RseP [Hyphomicrobium sp.]